MTSAEKQRAYYAANREKKRAYFREWEARSKERRKMNVSRTNEVRRVVNKRWQEKNRDKIKGYQLKYRYKLAVGEYERLHELQAGCCAICRDVLERVCVDHCHDTGKVRSLLCQKCNAGIGMFRDNPALVAKAFWYLTQHKQIGEVA